MKKRGVLEQYSQIALFSSVNSLVYHVVKNFFPMYFFLSYSFLSFSLISTTLLDVLSKANIEDEFMEHFGSEHTYEIEFLLFSFFFST